MRNLLIMLSLFLFSSVVQADVMDSGPQVFYYYKSSVNTSMCNAEPQPVCDAYTISGGTTHTPNRGACDYSTAAQQLKLTYTMTNNSTGASTSFTANAGTRQQITCPANYILSLNGCSANCIPKPVDPCKSKEGLKVSAYGTCGSMTCKAGHVAGPDCQGTYNSAVQQPVISYQDCAANSPTLPAGEPYWKSDVDAGKQTVTLYCEAEYTYTGSSLSEAQPTGLAPFTYLGLIPRGENGACPPNYVPGHFGSGSTMQPVCYPNSGAGGTCPAHQIKVNNVCTPVDEVGTCPAGQSRNDSGDCAETNSDDPDNPNNPDDPDTGNNGGGGGGNNGGSGSGGSGSGGADSSKKGAGTFSGSGGSATLSGTCDTPPVCSGDPINCAILHQKWASDCEMSTISDADKAGIATANTETDTFLNGIKADYQGTLNNALNTIPDHVPASSACIADSSFHIFTATIAIPISKLCPYFQTIRLMLLMVSYLFSARVIFGAIGGGGIRV